MGEIELHKAIQEINSKMKFLFISGYTGKGIYEKYQLETDMELLPKPFRTNELTAKMRDVLNR